MTEVVLKEMLGESHLSNTELVDRLKFDNDIITKSTVGKVSNSGPRVGVGVFMTGSFYEFANRPQRLKEAWILVPAVSMIGYQLGGPVRGNR